MNPIFLVFSFCRLHVTHPPALVFDCFFPQFLNELLAQLVSHFRWSAEVDRRSVVYIPSAHDVRLEAEAAVGSYVWQSQSSSSTSTSIITSIRLCWITWIGLRLRLTLEYSEIHV